MVHPRDTLNEPRRPSGPNRSKFLSPTRFLTTAVALLAMACAGDSSVDPVEVRNLTLALEPTKLFIAEGQNGQLHAKLIDDNGTPLPANDLSWTSSDPKVATVTDAGVVTGLSSGMVTITASAKGKKNDADVNVRGKGKLEIHLSSGSGQSGPVGETLPQALVVEVRDRTGAGVPGVEVNWQATGGDGSPSAPTTTTNQNGLTQVLWTLGPSLGNQTLQAKVNGAGTVDFPATGTPGVPASVTVSPDDVSMSVGTKQQFSAVVADQFGHPVDAGSIIWVSTAGDVLYVDDTGVATGMSPGSAVIEAYAETVSGGANVDVTGLAAAPEVSTVAVSPEAHTFTALGQTLQLAAVAHDGAGEPLTGINFNWSSTDPSIATVDDMGLVLAKAVGTVSMIVSAVCCDGATDTASLVITQVPAAVEVSPATFVLDVDQTATLTAEVRDAEGNPMTYAPSWTSSDPLIATVDGQGVVTALASGSVTIEAQASDVSGTASAEIGASVADMPQQVVDLAHVGDGILGWTQVDDGTGGPADYTIRHGCPTISWADAYDTEVSVAGTAIGDSFEYDTHQLSGSCEYQLVTYRGTLNVDAVFGSLSNIATVAVETTQIAASIEVSPSTFSLDVGQTQQLSATVLDENGQVIAGEVDWSSISPTIASIDADGLVTALAQGSAEIEARLQSSTTTSSLTTTSSSEVVGTASGTVEGTENDGEDTGGGSTEWPNEPGTFNLLSDRSVTALDEGGWNDCCDRLSVQNDPTGPASPSGVLQFFYPEGAGGSGKTVPGGSSSLGVPSGTKELYLGFWMKLSDPWQEHSSSDSPKLVFMVDKESGGGGDPLVINRNPDGQIGAFIQNGGNPPNRFDFSRLATVFARPGDWVQVEILAVMNSEKQSSADGPFPGQTIADGELHLWVNGTKIYQETDLWYSDAPTPDWDVAKIEPLWGGQGDTLYQNNHLWVDHVRVRGSN